MLNRAFEIPTHNNILYISYLLQVLNRSTAELRERQANSRMCGMISNSIQTARNANSTGILY
jgi:hypothetical protein